MCPVFLYANFTKGYDFIVEHTVKNADLPVMVRVFIVVSLDKLYKLVYTNQAG